MQETFKLNTQPKPICPVCQKEIHLEAGYKRVLGRIVCDLECVQNYIIQNEKLERAFNRNKPN